MIQDAVSKEYRLGQKLNILGAVQRATLELNQKASAPINYLFRQVGLECRVGVFYQDMVLITTTTGHMASTAGIAYTGPLLPTYCSALGRAILSCLSPKQVKAHFQKIELIAYTPNTVTDPEIINKELEETRQRGYSLELQEVTMNMESVGAPILGAGTAAGRRNLPGGVAVPVERERHRGYHRGDNQHRRGDIVLHGTSQQAGGSLKQIPKACPAPGKNIRHKSLLRPNPGIGSRAGFGFLRGFKAKA